MTRALYTLATDLPGLVRDYPDVAADWWGTPEPPEPCRTCPDGCPTCAGADCGHAHDEGAPTGDALDELLDATFGGAS